MSDLLAARAQMGTSLAFYIIFASLGVGLPLLHRIAEGLALWRKVATWMCIASPKSSSAGSLSSCSPRLLLVLAPGHKHADHLWPNHSSTAILTTKGRES